MKDNGVMINNMVKEQKNGLMDLNILDLMLWEKNKVLVNIIGVMDQIIKEIGKITK